MYISETMTDRIEIPTTNLGSWTEQPTTGYSDMAAKPNIIISRPFLDTVDITKGRIQAWLSWNCVTAQTVIFAFHHFNQYVTLTQSLYTEQYF